MRNTGAVLSSLTFIMLLAFPGLARPRDTQIPLTSFQTDTTYTEDFSTYIAKDYTENTIWNVHGSHLTLSRQDAVEQSAPAVIADGVGGAFVVWQDKRAGDWDIYGQRLDGDGNRLWTDLKINSDSGGSSQITPDIALDDEGNLIVVWADDRNGNWDIYAQRISSTRSKLWTSDICINRDDSGSDQNAPSVAVGQNAGIFVVWSDGRDEGRHIYGQSISSAGLYLWANDVRVGTNPDLNSQYRPELATYEGGGAIVVWGNSKHSSDDGLYAQRLNNEGDQLWPDEMRLATSSNIVGMEVQVDTNNGAFVTWGIYGPLYMETFVQRIDSNGNELWTSDISLGEWKGSRPSLALCENGDVVITTMSGDIVYAFRLNPDGNSLWDEDLQVNHEDARLHFSEGYAAVAFDDTGKAFVVWEDQRNGERSILGQKLNTAGTLLWTLDRPVHYSTGTVDQSRAALAVDATNTATVVWVDKRNENVTLYAQRISNKGTLLWEHEMQVNTINLPTVGYHDFGYTDIDVAVDVNVDGEAAVAWTSCDSEGGCDIYVQQLDAQGNRLWPTEAKVGVDSASVDVAILGNNDVYVVWAGVYVQKLDANGTKRWADAVNVGDGRLPAIDLYEDGDVLICWSQNEEEIYTQRVDSVGATVWSTPTILGACGFFACDKSVSIDSRNGDVVIAWAYDYHTSKVQKLDSSGQFVWAEDLEIDGVFPQIVMNILGDLATVTEDMQLEVDGNTWRHDLLAHLFDENGQALWLNPKMVNAPEGGIAEAGTYDVALMRPEASINTDGDLVVIWTDYRNGNRDIYSQSLNSYGNRRWGNDRSLVHPDLFHLSQGTAQSRNVDTTDDTITEATLTAQHILQGGSVNFYLTNDGGAHWAAVQPGVTHIFTTTGSDLRWRVEMASDPRGRDRSPIIDTLRIEYATASADGDDYEPDDTCTQAQSIQVGGVAQTHNFHQYQDDDWVWFDAQAGNSYLVKTTNEGERAHALLEIYAECGEPPTELPVDFGTGASVAFEAEASRRYYVRTLHHDGSVYGLGTEYTLQVGQEGVPAQTPGAVIIVAGRLYASDPQQPLITATGNRAYEIFRDAGYAADDIQYLNAETTELGVDAAPSWENVRDAVQTWARTRVGPEQPVWLYLINHGQVDRFHNDVNEEVTPAELDLWLDNLEQHSKVDQVTVVFDACFSGSFIDTYTQDGYGIQTLSREDRQRVIISSTSSQWWAYGPPNDDWEPYLFFSAGFLHALGREGGYQNVWKAYQAGVQYVESLGQQPGWGISVGQQTPWLDDNGNQKMDTRDGTRAQQRGLGHAVAMGGMNPYIESLTVTEPDEHGAAMVAAEVVDDGTVETVWVRVFAPSFEAPQSADGSIPVLEVPEVELELEGEGVFRGTYSGFTEKGVYQVGVYARDADGNYARPRWVWVGGQKVYLPLILRGGS